MTDDLRDRVVRLEAKYDVEVREVARRLIDLEVRHSDAITREEAEKMVEEKLAGTKETIEGLIGNIGKFLWLALTAGVSILLTWLGIKNYGGGLK